MKRIEVVFFLVVVIILAACSPAGQGAAVEPSASPETLAEPTPTQGSAAVSSTEATAGTASPQDVEAACQVVSSEPDPEILKLIPQVTDGDWVQGNEDAPVTLIVYSDLQCPYCALFEPNMTRLLEEHPDEVRTVFRHFPLPSHGNALLAAQAAESAGKQDFEKFFEMKDFLFSEQQNWSPLPAAEFETWLMDKASQFDLDSEQFKKDLTSEEIVKKVKDAQDNGIAIGLPGTPFTLYNHKPFSPSDYASLEGVLKLVGLEDRQFTECPPDVIEPGKSYTATLKTDKGDIVLELLTDAAPVTVNSFVYLAQNDWFDNVTFHRVLPGFVAQSGDPSGTGMGEPGYVYDNEISMDLKYDAPGMVGMANSGANTNGSQFFITFDALPDLDGQYTIFAKVIDGMDVAEKLTARNPEAGGDLPPGDVIQDVVIEAK